MRHLRFVAPLFATLVAASSAHGQVVGAQAEALFRQGRELLVAGKVSEACSAFEQSQRLEPAITTLLNLAGCREMNRQYASAWGYFLQAERETRASVDEESVKFHALAESRAKALEGKVSKLTISVSAAHEIDGLVVLRGTTPVEASAWNRALPIDGGTYTVTARAPGATAWTATVIVDEQADTKTVDIPKLQVATPEPEEEEEEGEPVPEAPPRSRRLAVPIAVGAVAVVCIGGAIAFELSAESTFEESQAEPDPMTSDRLFEKANHKRYAAEALAVTGLVAGGVAVWLYLRTRNVGPAPTTAASRGVHVVPTVTTEYSGVQFLGRF